MPQAKRPEIEELLTLLFDEIEPKDERVSHFRERVETQMKRRLKYRKKSDSLAREGIEARAHILRF